MTDQTWKILLRVSTELFNRSNRVKSYLRRVDPGECGEYGQLVETIGTALEGIEETVLSTLEFNKTIWHHAADEFRGNPLNKLSADLEKFSRWLANIHELLVFLPRENVSTESIYTLEASFNALFDPKKQSVILGSVYNALEFDFIQIVSERLPDLKDIILDETRNIVLQLPICDRDSPPAWAVLAHELGHALDLDKGFSETVYEDFAKDLQGSGYDTLLYWCGELSADLIAARALGPAPILALLSWQYSFYPLMPTFFIREAYKTHPTTRWRLRAVSEYLHNVYAESHVLDFVKEEIDFYEMAWSFHIDSMITDPRRRGIVKLEDEGIFNYVIKPIASHLADKILTLDMPAHQLEARSIDRCRDRLGKGLPIGAQGKDRAYLRKRIAAFRKDMENKPANDRVGAFKNLVSIFNESPMSLPQILASCHKRRLDVIKELISARDGAYAERSEISKMCHELDKVDERVGSSIRSNSVHTMLEDKLKLRHSNNISS